ncbi:hypothetical protein F8388_018345 [Cannabis sativa]|uniref:Uncharacterized protein n=1 Tax=Cannabis sativa TaxID=3483 RepID=A0A7J6E7Z9_CANSA|nr:hypothetical protein G4B88_019945 [Cannabis sativa]KAF4393854.1 hypothetical protein F8388_018345 [Cannabis sativa]
MNNTFEGFKEGMVACCGSGPYRGVLSCGGKRGVKEYDLCENPSQYLFFDSGHLTDRAYHQFSIQAWSEGDSIIGGGGSVQSNGSLLVTRSTHDSLCPFNPSANGPSRIKNQFKEWFKPVQISEQLAHNLPSKKWQNHLSILPHFQQKTIMLRFPTEPMCKCTPRARQLAKIP